ncbi:hypothetical protein Mapa_015739 [Marchantia paleacea]|nr:hypothetical protein Mapa_015739 [Marchantia paleacea]
MACRLAVRAWSMLSSRLDGRKNSLFFSTAAPAGSSSCCCGRTDLSSAAALTRCLETLKFESHREKRRGAEGEEEERRRRSCSAPGAEAVGVVNSRAASGARHLGDDKCAAAVDEMEGMGRDGIVERMFRSS